MTETLRDDSEMLRYLRGRVRLAKSKVEKERLKKAYNDLLAKLHNDPTSNIRKF